MGYRYRNIREDRQMAARLNQWLGENDMTASGLSRLTGVHVSTIYHMTSGGGGTSVAVLRDICKAAGIDANWLLGLKGRGSDECDR